MTPPSPSDLDPKDHLEILDLISEYSRSFDSGDLDAFADLFTDGGSLVTPVGSGTTREEIRGWAEARWKLLRAEGVTPRHFQTNTLLTRTGPDEVTGTTQLLLLWLSSETGEARVRAVARYHDDFRNTNDGWRFQRRSIE